MRTVEENVQLNPSTACLPAGRRDGGPPPLSGEACVSVRKFNRKFKILKKCLRAIEINQKGNFYYGR